MKAILKEKIVSYNYIVRGEGGEEVEVLFSHEEVKIVENKKGQRYSVHESKLDYEAVFGGADKYKSVFADMGKKEIKMAVGKRKSNGKRRNS
jgi:hypothetical protein